MTAADESSPEKISYRTVIKKADVRVLALSRAALKLGLATLSYGVMVHLARLDASQMQISLVGATSYIAALLFGAQGGLLADSVAKRSAIAAGCFAQAALCFLIPIIFGEDVSDLMLLMFLVSALSQVVSPGIKAVVALVSTPAQMATTGALISVIGSTASAIGSSILAPILIKVGGIDLVFYTCSLVFVLGAFRASRLPDETGKLTWLEARRAIRWKPEGLSPRSIATWIRGNQGVSSIILLGAIVTAVFESFSTMVPVYVRDVLDADPANSVYIFSLASIGFLIGAIGGPWLIARWGERRTMVIAVFTISISMVMFGLVGVLAPILAPISPLRLLELFGLEINDKILAASVIAIPANFGSSISSACTQVFVNRTVPVAEQSSTFGLQEVQKNLLNTVAALGVGVLSVFLPVEVVFLLTPLIVVWPVLRLVKLSHQLGARKPMTTHDAWRSLLGEQQAPAAAGGGTT
jgi:MFS family permease